MKERIAMPVIFSASAAFSSSCATALEADLCQISTMSCWKIISTMSSWKIILDVVTKLSQRVAKLLHVFSDRPEIPGVDTNGKLSTGQNSSGHKGIKRTSWQSRCHSIPFLCPRHYSGSNGHSAGKI